MTAATITINLNKKELHIKKMILALKNSENGKNPYRKHSESDIAKMLFEPVLKQEFKKYGRAKR